MIKIKVKEIISLFDERRDNLRHNISSIINLVGEDLGVALFKRYYKKTFGKKVAVGRHSPISGTMKGNKGPRLDRWIYIHQSKKKIVACQTEIKNWSAFAIGGRPINIDSDKGHIGLLNWQERCGQLLEKKKNKENKVFYPMRDPRDRDLGLKDKIVKIEPLMIYWLILSKNSKFLNPFFSFNLPVKIRGFKKLNVFSMSNYLRSIKNVELILDMPIAQNRILLLKKYFRISKI